MCVVSQMRYDPVNAMLILSCRGCHLINIIEILTALYLAVACASVMASTRQARVDERSYYYRIKTVVVVLFYKWPVLQ